MVRGKSSTCRKTSFFSSGLRPGISSRAIGKSETRPRTGLTVSRKLTAPREADYIEIADRLLRNPALRQRQGQAMLDRFRAEFRPERLGERYRAFLAPFI